MVDSEGHTAYFHSNFRRWGRVFRKVLQPSPLVGNKEIKNMENNEMTYEKFMAMKQAMDNAENDTTPFAVVDDNEVKVVGDANKTETKKRDYVLKMAYPAAAEWREYVKNLKNAKVFNETPNYLGVERTFSNVWVPPAVHTAVQSTFLDLYKLFYIITEDGQIRDMTNDEVMQALSILNQEMCEAMYHAVATILKINVDEEQFMLASPTAQVVVKMIDDFPEIINGVDFFTDESSETA